MLLFPTIKNMDIGFGLIMLKTGKGVIANQRVTTIFGESNSVYRLAGSIDENAKPLPFGKALRMAH